MRWFIDTEFNENVDPVELISIGVVSDSGKELYAVNENYVEARKYLLSPSAAVWPHLDSCNEWVKEHVFPYILLPDRPVDVVGGLPEIREALASSLNDGTVEFWGYYPAFDHYLMVRLFKNFDRWPKNWSKACFDVYQFAKHVGVQRLLPTKLKPEHNALIDARWTRDAFNSVMLAYENHAGKVTREKVWP